jgi:hypothetical protein
LHFRVFQLNKVALNLSVKITESILVNVTTHYLGLRQKARYRAAERGEGGGKLPRPPGSGGH